MVDRNLREAGHEVVRTPPYHPEFQPIELVWGAIKRHVADHNTFRLADIPGLIRTAIDSITPEVCAAFFDRCVALVEASGVRARAIDAADWVINVSSFEESSEEESEE